MKKHKTFLFSWLSITLLSCGNNKNQVKEEIVLVPQFTFSSYGNPLNKDAWVNDIIDTLNRTEIGSTPVGDSIKIWTIKQDSLNKKIDPFSNPDLPFNLYLGIKRLGEAMTLSLNKRECLDSIQNIDFNRYVVFLVTELSESTTYGLRMFRTEDGKINLKLMYTYVPVVNNNPLAGSNLRTTSIYKIEKENADSLFVYYEMGTAQMDTIRYPLRK